jgi:signal transduction histidine kinase/CheY-like chemotaxis protein
VNSNSPETGAATPVRSIALCLALLAAGLLGAWLTARLIAAHQQARFDYEVGRIDSAIELRMKAYVQILRGGLGLFVASDEVTRMDWRHYVESLQLQRRYPGIRTLGFSPAVRHEDLDAFIARVRSEPLPPGLADPRVLREFHLRPPPPPIVAVTPDVHAPVLFPEPLTPLNEHSIGVDMMQDAGRKAAMDAAAAGDDAVLSPRLRLQQADASPLGFVAYLAVHREQQLLGWVTAVFFAQNFMRGLIGADSGVLEFAVFDGDSLAPEQLLYSTAGVGADGDPLPLQLAYRPDFARRVAIDLPGRRWTLQAASAPGFVPFTDRLAPWLVALGGALASLLLYVSARGGARWRAQAAALERAQAAVESANRAKGDFLANMSHEIRTPLNAILGTAELLGDTRLDAGQRQSLETIAQSGDHLLGVINDILDFTKVESGMLELEDAVFDLRRTVEEALELVAHKAAQKRLDLACDFAPGTPEMARGDSGRVRQVLANYLSNAVKFTEHGDIAVEVTAQPADAGRHRFRIAVRDTGVGIAADRLARLFRTFSQVDASTTRRYGGSGLGLAISKRLAERMGGEVGVDSHPGRGSTFWFSFVAATDAAWMPPQRADRGALEGKRLLVVDDNDTNRRILRATARDWGMQVSDTASAQQALELIARGEVFDLAVLDYFMPEMDGVALAAQIRRQRSHEQLRLLLLSSAQLPSGELRDFDLMRVKPLRRSGLLDAFLDLLVGATAEHEPAGVRGDAPRAVLPLRILLVEDNLVNRQVGTRMLESLGYGADVVENGAEAVAAASRQIYDLVLMDIHMPVMDGLDATRQIRAMPAIAQPRIYAMSASVLDSERQACLDAGMNRHLAKPFRRRELEKVLREVAEAVHGAAAPPAQQADPQQLAKLVDDLGTQGAADVAAALIEDMAETLSALQGAAQQQDSASLRRIGASLRANCEMLGASSLAEACEQLGLADEAPAAVLADVVARYRELGVELERWRAVLTTTAG